MAQCEYRKQDGSRCRAHAITGTALCVSHNPEAAESKRLGSQKGGRNRRAIQRVEQPSELVCIDSMQSVQRLLWNTLADVRNGSVDPAVGRTIGYLAVVAIRVSEAAEFEDRILRAEHHIMKLYECLTEQAKSGQP